MNDTFNAAKHPVTKGFMQELAELCKRWNAVPVPTYGGEVSFHDSMRLIPFDRDAEEFLNHTDFDPKDFIR